MRCGACMRNIAAGVEAQKMIVEYQQGDGSVKVFGYMMTDGPLKAATGQMVRGWHHKCWWVTTKREAKGDAVSGRVVAGGPTGYDIDQMVLTKDDIAALGITVEEAQRRGTVQLSRRLTKLRATARELGKNIGDPQVQEAFNATEKGGPYPHVHHHRLDTYQLIAHLTYAHGLTDPQVLKYSQDSHAWHHALWAQADITALRAADQETAPSTRDWREQFTAELDQEHRA